MSIVTDEFRKMLLDGNFKDNNTDATLMLEVNNITTIIERQSLLSRIMGVKPDTSTKVDITFWIIDTKTKAKLINVASVSITDAVSKVTLEDLHRPFNVVLG